MQSRYQELGNRLIKTIEVIDASKRYAESTIKQILSKYLGCKENFIQIIFGTKLIFPSSISYGFDIVLTVETISHTDTIKVQDLSYDYSKTNGDDTLTIKYKKVDYILPDDQDNLLEKIYNELRTNYI